MLLRAGEVNYDYVNERVSAIGNVQVYYKGTELEADQVIYDQKTKRMHAEGHIRLAEPDGKVTFADIIDLSDDFRDGFVDSLRLEMPEQTRLAANRADRSSGNIHRFPERRLYRLRALQRRSRKSRRNGRSEPPGSSTIRARR